MHKSLVLVHGSWHGGWGWDAVIHHLSAKVHAAYAPTLPGPGPGATHVGITHRDCTGAVVAYTQEHDRHGETAWTISRQHTDVADLPLTAQGEAEAVRLGERLEGLRWAAVLTSPL
jgi:hypothetical protein